MSGGIFGSVKRALMPVSPKKGTLRDSASVKGGEASSVSSVEEQSMRSSKSLNITLESLPKNEETGLSSEDKKEIENSYFDLVVRESSLSWTSQDEFLVKKVFKTGVIFTELPENSKEEIDLNGDEMEDKKGIDSMVPSVGMRSMLNSTILLSSFNERDPLFIKPLVSSQTLPPSCMINSKEFCPKIFLNTVHKEASIRELQIGLQFLKQSIEENDAALKLIVKNNFDHYTSVLIVLQSLHNTFKSRSPQQPISEIQNAISGSIYNFD